MGIESRGFGIEREGNGVGSYLGVWRAQLSQLSVVAVISDTFVTETMKVLWHPEAWFYNLQYCTAFHLFNKYLLDIHLVSGPVLLLEIEH